jgi:hypothetical protein
MGLSRPPLIALALENMQKIVVHRFSRYAQRIASTPHSAKTVGYAAISGLKSPNYSNRRGIIQTGLNFK